MTFRLDIVVGPDAIDTNAHVNNIAYLRWMQDAAIAHAEATGGAAATRAAGASWVVRSHHVEYLRPAFAGERLAILTWVSTLRRSSSLRSYRVVRGDQTIARGETVWVFVDAVTGRPRPITAEVAAAFTLVRPDEEPR